MNANQRGIDDLANEIQSATVIARDLLQVAEQASGRDLETPCNSAVHAAIRYVEDIKRIADELLTIHLAAKGGGQ